MKRFAHIALLVITVVSMAIAGDAFAEPVAAPDNSSQLDPAVSLLAFNCPGCDDTLGPTIPPNPNEPGSCPSGQTGCNG